MYSHGVSKKHEGERVQSIKNNQETGDIYTLLYSAIPVRLIEEAMINSVSLAGKNYMAPLFLSSRIVELYDYIKLDMNEKANLLWDEGVFVDKYIDLNIITNLYYLHNFYVEVVLSNSNGRISEITPFKKGDRLDKYIKHIDLKELI